MRIIYLALFATAISFQAFADDRYLPAGVEIARDADGTIKRSAGAKAAFRNIHHCPSTNLHRGACPGYQIDHVIPLACRGRDVVENMQWLPIEIKTAAGTLAKDRWEQKVYCQ